MATLAGMVVGLGLVLAVRAVRPAPPSLAAALEQLSAGPMAGTLPPPGTPPSSAGDRRTWLPPAVVSPVEGRLGVSDADLAILGRTRRELAARKLALALAGLLTPALLGLVGLLFGVPVPFVVPGAAGLGLAAVGWLLPSAEAREAAGKARAEFRSNLESFLTLVAGERRAPG
jgi:tight adherence protein C